MSPEKTLAAEPVMLVDVAVPVPLRQLFSYRIPEDLNPAEIRAGYRVLVPFRAKLIHGITMSSAYTAEADGKYRFLAAYERERRLLSPEIAELVRWLTHYYKGAVGEAVRMALPPGTLSEQEVCFQLTAEGEALHPDTDDGRILTLLQGKTMSKKRWETRAQTKIPFRDIRRWEESGLLEMVARGRIRESVPHETAAVLTDKGRTTHPDELTRAPKQRELLRWLQQRDGGPPPSLGEIGKNFRNGTTLAARLADHGYVKKIRVPKHELMEGAADFEPETIKLLTPEQDTALREIRAALDRKRFQPFLLFGVTSSGKTEVYLRAVRTCLDQGRQALLLVPEIALTPLMQRRIENRFGERLAILHSAVGAGKRTEAWARILAGNVDVVLGARSGIFAPLPRLGLVIVDEEHDQSYKQNDGIRYHARDLALVRAKMADAAVVLGSATPSLESWHNHERGRSTLLTMKQRATQAKLPTVDIVDMREEFQAVRARPLISRLLAERMGQALTAGHQVMILLNRRGYHSFLLCRKCGAAVMCDRCEVTLTYHQTDRSLKCHYCARSLPVPDDCPGCGSAAAMMQFFGEGTQQIQEAVQKMYPDFTVDRLDRDRLGRKEAHYEILAEFERGKTQVLVGTQMIAKGHDFPNVTLVGIVNADLGLRIPDFRSAEVVFQLITQVSGRSGRGRDPGSVVVQTYMPEHYSITCAAAHDFPGFLERESRYRSHLFYSPYAYMASILVTHENETLAENACRWIAARLMPFKGNDGLVILGPAKAPIGKIKNSFRFQIVLKSSKRATLHRLAELAVEEAVKERRLPRQAIILDIDPYQFF